MIGHVVLLVLAAVGAGDSLKTELLSDDTEKAKQAAKKLGEAKRADVLLEAISLGTTPRIASAILDALVECKSARALEVFLRYADNRNADLRKRALAGVVQVGDDKQISESLRQGLGDPDAGVRAHAASFVAKRKQQ